LRKFPPAPARAEADERHRSRDASAPEFRKPQCQAATLSLVTTGHSRSKNGIASLAYDPVVHADVQLRKLSGSFLAAWIAGSSPAMTK
jgi:hypothetical protein